MNQLQKKDYFYELCEEVGVDYPDTLLISKEMGLDFEVPFEYPVILKSSESIHYWEYPFRSEEHTSELQSRFDIVCRLLLEKKKEEDQTRESNEGIEEVK